MSGLVLGLPACFTKKSVKCAGVAGLVRITATPQLRRQIRRLGGAGKLDRTSGAGGIELMGVGNERHHKRHCGQHRKS